MNKYKALPLSWSQVNKYPIFQTLILPSYFVVVSIGEKVMIL